MNIKSKSRGRLGTFVPYALILADIIVLNAIFLGLLMTIGKTFTSHEIKVLLLLVNTAYLLPVRMSFGIKNQRHVAMERIVAKALEMVAVHCVIFLALIAFLGINYLPWEFFIEFYAALAVVFTFLWIVTRKIVKRYRRRGRNYVRVVIIGTGSTAGRTANELLNDPGFGYNILGFFGPEDILPVIPDGRYLGPIENLREYMEANPVDEIYYTIPGNDEKMLNEVLTIADENMVKFNYVPQLSRTVARAFHLTHVGGMPLLTAHYNPLDRVTNRAVKRVFDVAVSGTFLLFSPIIFIPVAIAIKMSSPGPVFFKQKRTGYRGQEFLCYKFRTMKVNAASDTVQATAHDPRKTRVGDFLRHSSIDELPQFINVLKGDMSIVGPRPHMLKHTADYSRLIERYMLRHIIKPGITGWAQVTGYRGATTELWQMEGRVEKDVWYIENWSLLLDLKIMVKTVTNALHGEENAY